MWRTPATLAGSLDDVPNPGAPVSSVILGARDQLRRHLRGGRRRRRRDALQRDLLAGACTTASAASCRRSPRATTSSWSTLVVDAGARARPASTLDDVELVAATQGPGPGRRAARRPLDAPRRSPPRASCRSRRSTTCRGTSPPTSCAMAPSAPFEPPFLCLIASGGHTLLAHVRRARRLRGARPHARRRRRRGVRQGRADARARLSRAAPRSSAWPRGGDPTRSRSRARRRAARGGRGRGAGLRRGPRLLLRRAEDGAALPRARARRGRGARARAPTSPPPTSARSSTAWSLRAERALERTGLERLALGGGVAANGELRARLAELGVRVHVPARALCTDNAAMIASAARFADALRLSRLPRPRRLRDRRAARGERRHGLLQARLPPLRRRDARCCARLQGELGFELLERDITGDEALQRAYFERIPVVALDGEELFDYFVRGGASCASV